MPAKWAVLVTDARARTGVGEGPPECDRICPRNGAWKSTAKCNRFIYLRMISVLIGRLGVDFDLSCIFTLRQNESWWRRTGSNRRPWGYESPGLRPQTVALTLKVSKIGLPFGVTCVILRPRIGCLSRPKPARCEIIVEIVTVLVQKQPTAISFQRSIKRPFHGVRTHRTFDEILRGLRFLPL